MVETASRGGQGVQRRTHRWRSGVGLMMLCGLLLSGRLGHAAMIHMGLDDLAKTADTVVLGTVTKQESAWDAQHTAIYTDVAVAVERAILGTPGAVITLRVAGGRVGGMGMRTSNDATFKEGERVIVFLHTTTAPGSIVGMQHGKFLVQDNTVTSHGEQMSVEAFIAAIQAAAR